MNFSSALGFTLSLIVFALAILTSSANLKVFLDLHALLIVVGGTLAVSFVSFSLKQIMTLLKVLSKRLFGLNRTNYAELVSEIVQISQASRKGQAALLATARQAKHPFLRETAELIAWKEADVTTDQLRELLDIRADTHFVRYLEEADIFKSIAKFPPAFGLMGTTLGMISLLNSLGGADAQKGIGTAMAMALVATLYGIVLSNFVCLPIAENLTQQTKEDSVARRMIVDAVVLIAEDVPTKFVEERALSYLLPSERTRSTKGPRSVDKAA